MISTPVFGNLTIICFYFKNCFSFQLLSGVQAPIMELKPPSPRKMLETPPLRKVSNRVTSADGKHQFLKDRFTADTLALVVSGRNCRYS